MAGRTPRRIELLGGFRITVNRQPVAGGLTGRLQALVSYLALRPGVPVSRQEVAFLFWADSEEPQARTNLRQLLHHLRAALPVFDAELASDHQTLCWSPGGECTIDWVEFERAVAADELETATRLYTGDLLPAMYDEWIEPDRDRLRQKYESVLDRLAAAAEQRRDLSEAIRLAEIRLARDPLREASYQALIRLHSLNGDRARALRVYQHCADVLRRELDVEPGPATRRAREEAIEAHAVQPRSKAPDSAPARHPAGPPLVGRRTEWRKMREVWRYAAGGNPSVLLLTGEAGIGKTRLLDELLSAAAEDAAWTALASCYEGGRALPYTAAADWLRSTAIRPHVEELSAAQRSLLARLLPEILSKPADAGYRPAPSEPWRKRQFFEALARAVLRPGAPLVLAIDDAQWCDPETIEWAQYLIRFDASAPLLILATARSGETGAARLLRPGRDTELALGPLEPEEAVWLASRISGREVDGAGADFLYRQTRGNPLFVIETARAGFPAAPGVPSKVHAVITERLSRLSADARELTFAAAVIGRPFTPTLAAAVSGLPEHRVVQAIDELWARRILQPEDDGTYDFSHGLLRDASIGAGPAKLQQAHRRVAEALEISTPSTADAACARLADHWERAGLPERAIQWYRDAAFVMQRRFAEADAIASLSKALHLLERLSPSPGRDRLELDLLLALGPSLSATHGYASPEAGKVYARTRILCELDPESGRQHAALAGSWVFHTVRGELRISRDIAERCLALAAREGDPLLMAAGHFSLGVSMFHLGAAAQAREHLEACLRLAGDPPERLLHLGTELIVFCRSYLAHVLWLMGDAEASQDQSERALARANSVSHPFSLALALAYSAMLHHFRGEPEPAQEQAEAAAAVCRRFGFRYYLSWTPIISGWARVRLGDTGGMGSMLAGLRELRETGAALRAPYYLGLIAEAFGQAGDTEAGLHELERAMSLGETSGERWLQPELQRIRGDLLGQHGERAQAQACYANAVRLAREMRLRAWETRAESRLTESPPKARRQQA